MASTGERYVEARRNLMERAAPSRGSLPWVATPEMSDDAIRSGTGRGWDEWCELIEKFPERSQGHTAIARHIREEHGVDAWWSQAVTVGYERITGLRLPHQMADGTFTANKSKTVTLNGEEFRQLLLDEEHRVHLFPNVATEVLSKPTAKAIRLSVGPGVAIIRLDGLVGDRTKVTVQHERLPTFDDVEEWKFYWAEWLDAIDVEDT